eukprot:CAMPEP_0171587894 /NCGR_PEP_ID=MMETSP0961-20121227/13662_1 /TAXON_ID=87120 /ORGANISM="Aurantiochytrium limacinum, Strain ATCCMYA-1381" /LENGTH=54 /DNA_ID=CAMNT_0012146363 /DNA_START=24 /DNA_END=184 /DNA_ORIENTATION=+
MTRLSGRDLSLIPSPNLSGSLNTTLSVHLVSCASVASPSFDAIKASAMTIAASR